MYPTSNSRRLNSIPMDSVMNRCTLYQFCCFFCPFLPAQTPVLQVQVRYQIWPLILALLLCTGQIVHRWNASALMEYVALHEAKLRKQFNRCHSYECRDRIHGNTLAWDWENGYVYFNSRHLDAFYKLEWPGGRVVWGVGRTGVSSLALGSGVHFLVSWCDFVYFAIF